MYNSRNDLPPVTRLNTVHHQGVPYDKCYEHFVFVSESTELVMIYDGDFVISARGFYSDKWHPRWYEVYRSPFIREILPIWYESVCFACLCQNMRHGFDIEEVK